ncbi:MAG: sodium:solute symporter [candidate division KSB1 bacterium]|nr:sodium:solute symporter [candidate division KSB1 bacterium]MDZ7333635.1 sodium:solute symporter [candidate division KSB1 bacterium]MDZ7358818.1 sodium:solute symporter [candidate division KSB1 bacterium]MDZ7376307.1 sodium:solute symporter [candidate division KSB1 bacterium]MDZ7398749.1 sodium:solute symporter [candidate division KSB1 bacterium]
MGFTPLDYGILLFYLIGVTVLGSWFGKFQKDTRDYFLGGRNLPWWAVCFSVVATETSTLTFISIPGIAYVSNLNFLQLTFGYILGRIIVSFVFLPAYYKGELATAYEFLGGRFGQRMRNFSSVIFQITRLLADGVRLFATAIPLSVITGWSYPVSIAVIGFLTVVYTYLGGIRAVVWIDVIQMVIYLGGAIVAGVFLLQHLPNGWQDVVAAAQPENKFQLFNFSWNGDWRTFFQSGYHFITSLVGGMFLSMASHGTDQLIVQRLLTCNNLRDSQKALITSGVLVMVQFAIFLTIGLMLYAFYHAQPVGDGSSFVTSSDEIFPKFIVEALPPGLSGLIIAGIFAAAMSTLSGSMNSLASSSVLDIYKTRFGKGNAPRKDLFISRLMTAVWGFVFIGGAMLFKDKTNPVVELGLEIASFTYGGLLGTFLLGVFFRHVKENAALIAQWSAIFFMSWIIISARNFTGIPKYAILIVLVIAFIWIFMKLNDRREQMILSVLLIGFVSLIRFVQPLHFFWPWYVFLGCSVALIVGVLVAMVARN